MPNAVRAAVLAGVVLVGAVAGCGDDGTDTGADRAAQVRSAARAAGLDANVADVLALAARGATATYQVSYAGTEGARLVVSQQPPDHRVDVIAAGKVIESRVLHDGVAYTCEATDTAGAKPRLACKRAAGALDQPGTFTAQALDEFTAQLASSRHGLDLTVEHRTIADTAATCLITAPKAGTAITGHGPTAETLCLSRDGAQLLVDAGGQRLVADSYTTHVPDGTFDVTLSR